MARRTYREAAEKYWGLPVPDGLKHGNNSWARAAYGCSCKECLPTGQRTWVHREDRPAPLTATERSRRSRANLRGKPVPPNVKHGIYARKFYGCPCDVCKEATRRASHRSKNAWMYRETAGHWTKGKDSTGAPVDRIWWPPGGSTAEDCPFEQCFHPHHKESRT